MAFLALLALGAQAARPMQELQHLQSSAHMLDKKKEKHPYFSPTGLFIQVSLGGVFR